MDAELFNLIIGVAGVLLAIVSLVYAVYTYRRSIKRKKLVYDVSRRQGIAQVGESSSDVAISLLVKPKEQPEFLVSGVYAHYIALANIGAEPVRKGDLPDSDPLRLTISKGLVLNVAVEDVTRPAIAFEVERPHGVANLNDPDTPTLDIRLHFEFLDQNDGAVICVITDSPDTRLAIEGTVIDMKEGVLSLRYLNKGIIGKLTRLKNSGIILQVILTAVTTMALVIYFYWKFGVRFVDDPAGLTLLKIASQDESTLRTLLLFGFLAAVLTSFVTHLAERSKRSPLPVRLRSAYRYSAYTDEL